MKTRDVLTVVVCVFCLIIGCFFGSSFTSNQAKTAHQETTNSRMVEVESGQISGYKPYGILRDARTGNEYLAIQDCGIIKLEQK